jgi:TorA maturation chaperone TorD
MATAIARQRRSASTELDIYRVFAASLGHPSRERFAWFSGRVFRELFKRLNSRLRRQRKPIPLGRFSDYRTYEAAYISLFEVGVPGPPVPLLESVYSKSSAAQEIVLDCVNFYDVLGLRPSGTAFPADHIVTQLEFLSAARFLRENAVSPENQASLCLLERDFIERHLLTWLSSAQEKLERLNPPVFPALLGLLAHALKNELGLLAKLSAAQEHAKSRRMESP